MSQQHGARAVMRPFEKLTPFADAVATAAALVTPVDDSITLPVERAADRVLAADVSAPADVPSADRAAMDGYAVRSADTRTATPASPVRLRVRGRLAAGAQDAAAVGPGECLEIATGATLPPSADAVVPVEEVRIGAHEIALDAAVEPSAHVAARGEDLRAGARVARGGRQLTPAVVAALAAVGVAEVEVLRQPRVLVVPTGDELVPLGEVPQPGKIWESNSVAVAALLAAAGAEVERSEIVADDRGLLRRSVERQGFDLVVTLGGTSVGRHDLVVDVVGTSGEVLVHGVAVKPGKPLLLARVAGNPLVGLPGFPTSNLLLAYALVRPMVSRLAGRDPAHPIVRQARLAEAVDSPSDKHQLLTVRLEGDRALPAYKASSTITSMSDADGWFDIPTSSEHVEADTPVEVKLF